ncbi:MULTISPECIES: proline reductase-associated electron transfer protein PrdC [Peptostreptococcaceae]|uniref:Proline reductase-associated electron transfer protein PrdC n=1 Tax=Terrisporobacter muris TaxID=2963284 RepID=A0A9X2M8D0_9FIRM|nr:MULTISPECIES: proline reductase-associated electron transfer protein PrdC [Peptostreptococcaceae]MCR1822138.1 proline reductase-associated electron transfer protein PrdC [Terrisporobacter muris]MDU6986408.1 proline reductase-associated electron transfer protein PrdC [Terrisporobacter othiniensis]MDY4128801.1 proline reductase-associated electron transfer protein PrdC [Peptostreptococcus porci]
MGLQKILLRQHVGAPCEAIVKVGDRVKKGSLIAKPTGLGANIFSSVYGEVKEITEDAIIIEKDEDQPEEFVELEGEDKLQLIKDAGVVGMGGAGFPTAIKLGTKVKYILVNAAECEPLLHHNVDQMVDNTELTIRGLKYVMEICQAEKGIFAIKAKNQKAVDALVEGTKGDNSLDIHLLPDIYPMGEERAVVREVLGILLQPTDLPSVADAVVINVETLQRVAEAIELKKPCFSKNVTVVGKLNGGTDPHVFMDVPVGTSVKELIERAGGIDGEYGEVIMGGPFTGKACELDAPITKTTGGIIVTQPFEDLKGEKMGLLVCACGGNEERMQDLAKKMNAEVVCVQKCKQAADVKGNLKCENPGNCPGQALKVMNIKKAGAKHILIGNCTDCSNTVMGSAPKMNVEVHHQTDHVLQTVGKDVIRYMTASKTVPQLGEEVEEVLVRAQSVEEPKVETVETSFTSFTDEGGLVINLKEGKDIYVEFVID